MTQAETMPSGLVELAAREVAKANDSSTAAVTAALLAIAEELRMARRGEDEVTE